MTNQKKKRSLSGIKPTGNLHLGNYLGMLEPALALQDQYECFYFVADLHALTTNPKAEDVRKMNQEMVAAMLAFGLDPEKCFFYRQSDVPEVCQLSWYLSTCVSMGDLSRAHAYKAAKDQGTEGKLNLGIFSYPVLMAADILLYDADIVPVGKDQVQHLEMARAIAKRFNHHYGDCLKEPQEKLKEEMATVPGIDGQKMSKSYNNGIEPLASKKALKKQVMAIVTDSKELEEVKDPDSCNVVSLFKLFASKQEVSQMEENYRKGGYGYGHAKLELLAKLEEKFAPARQKYQELLAKPAELDEIMATGAQKAKGVASEVLCRVRQKLGLTN